MHTKIPRIAAFGYLGLLTFFAALSGAESGGGLQSVFFNLPNVLPWVFGWLALLVAWRYEKTGGTLFLLLALASTFFFHTYRELVPFVIITLPLVVIGALFLCGNRRVRELA